MDGRSVMNEDEVSDIQMTWIYEYNDGTIYGLQSHGLGRWELLPMYCENPGIHLQHKQMKEHAPD